MTQHTGLIPCKECWQQLKYVKEAKEELGRARWPLHSRRVTKGERIFYWRHFCFVICNHNNIGRQTYNHLFIYLTKVMHVAEIFLDIFFILKSSTLSLIITLCDENDRRLNITLLPR